MKIQNIDTLFLTESEEGVKKALEQFKRKFPNLELYHGSRKRFHTGEKVEFRFRKRPLDTPPIINYLINSYLKTEFGLPVRNLLYLSQMSEISEAYGPIYMVIPVGSNYRLFYADGVQDFSADFGNERTMEDIVDRVFENMFDEGISEKDIDNLKRVIDYNYGIYFKNIYGASSSVDLDNALDDVLNNVDDKDKDKELVENFHSILIQEIKMYVEHVYTDDYKVEEINSSNDVPVPEYEIMGYFPDGFYVIRYEDVDKYFHNKESA